MTTETTVDMEKLVNRFVGLWNEIIASGESVELYFCEPDTKVTINTPVEIIWNDYKGNQSMCWNPTAREDQVEFNKWFYEHEEEASIAGNTPWPGIKLE